MDQLNNIVPQQQGNQNPTISSDSGCPSSISGFGVDNQADNQQYIHENQHPEAILLGHGLENDNIEEIADSRLASSISKTETSEFIPQVIEMKNMNEQKDEHEHLRPGYQFFPPPSFDMLQLNANVRVINYDDPKQIEQLIKDGNSSLTSFDVAISRGSVDEVEALLESGANSNARCQKIHITLHRLIKNPAKKQV